MCISDWSSDVCSSDLAFGHAVVDRVDEHADAEDIRQQNIFLPLVVADLSRAGQIIDRIIPFLDRRSDLLYIGVQVPGEARQELLKPWVGGRLKAFYDRFGARLFVEISHLSILIH